LKPIRWHVLLLLWMLVAAAAGCGKKGDPFVPVREFSAEIRNLSGAWDEGSIVLWGDVAGVSAGKQAKDLIKGARVYYGAYDPGEPPCEGCPVRYQGYYELGIETITGRGFQCRIPGKRKDALYYFKVHLMGPEGSPGPAPERIRLDPLEP